MFPKTTMTFYTRTRSRVGPCVEDFTNLRGTNTTKHVITQLSPDVGDPPNSYPIQWSFWLRANLPTLKVDVRGTPLRFLRLPIQPVVAKFVSTDTLLRRYFGSFLTQASRRSVDFCTSKDLAPRGLFPYLRDVGRGCGPGYVERVDKET